MKINEIKKKNGTIVYRASVYLGIDEVTGKKVKTSITARTRKEVKAKAKLKVSEFLNGGSTIQKQVSIKTYEELARLWLDSYKLTVKPQSLVSTKVFLNKHILPYFGNMKLDKITPSLIQEFLNGMASKLVNFNVTHSINKRILQLGVTLQLIPFNPANDVLLPKKQKKSKEKVKYIDKENLKKFMDYMKQLSNVSYRNFYDYVLYSLLLATGCRFGEVAALEWSDIDFNNQTITISKTYNPHLKMLSTPKSKSSIRTISVDKKTLTLLKLYQARQRQIFSEIKAPLPKVIFASTTLEYASLDVRKNVLANRCKEIDIPRITFHAFRHTHASLLLNAGISYKELQHRLGHANMSITLDIYSHISKEKEKEAVSYYEKAINDL